MSTTDKILNEHQLLSYVIKNPTDLYKIADNYFISNVGKAIYSSLLFLSGQSLSFTPRHITKEAHRTCTDVSITLVQSLMEVDFDQGKFKVYYTRLKKDYAKAEIQNHVLQETTSAVSTKEDLDVEAVASLIRKLQEGLALAGDDDAILLNGSQMATLYRGTIQARREGRYKFSTGDSLLDSHLVTGASPGDMTTLFAATGMAKSAYALNLVNRQINRGIPSLYVSLELGTIATLDRLIALRAKMPMNWLYPTSEGEVVEEAFDTAEKLLKDIEAFKLFAFIEEPSLGMVELEKQIELTKQRMGVDYLLVTIDLLTMMKEFSGSDATGIEEAMNLLHAIAKRQGVHIICVVQANRETDSANIKSVEQLDRLRPKNMKDIKNSGAIAERSRLVLSLFRPKHYAEKLFPEDDETDLMEDELIVTVLKQSQGMVGQKITYIFEGEHFGCYKPIILGKRKAKGSE